MSGCFLPFSYFTYALADRPQSGWTGLVIATDTITDDGSSAAAAVDRQCRIPAMVGGQNGARWV